MRPGWGHAPIVWIAKNFTNEHRATLDWLNEITDEKFKETLIYSTPVVGARKVNNRHSFQI
jgi:hypothetical protein